MDRNQHIKQDASEHFAVYLMAKTAESLGISATTDSGKLWESFQSYLSERDWKYDAEFQSLYPEYHINVNNQIPEFVARLSKSFPDSKFVFSIDEANFRNQGLKADFHIDVTNYKNDFFVSLKNYTGKGGITRPQVSSGTFLSFACGFIFERQGVGTFFDPRSEDATFRGSDSNSRKQILEHMGKKDLVAPLEKLEELQQIVRDRLLGLTFYDQQKIKQVVSEIVPVAQKNLITIFEILGPTAVRRKVLERAGLDGSEDLLYFDKDRSIDSITSQKFHDFCKLLNDESSTEFSVDTSGQSLKFRFKRDSENLLDGDVPLTINTNGAWHRPKKKYEGFELKDDSGHLVQLKWGQLRPYKSREIATSTNFYLPLRRAGLFVKKSK